MSKLTSLFKSRFQSAAHGSKQKQKGASALEYIVLAAVIVIAVALGASFLVGGGEGTIEGTFEEIKESLAGKDKNPAGS